MLNSTRVSFIDKAGAVIIPPKYKQAHSFKSGLAAVRLDQKWGFIDRNDKIIIPFDYDYVGDFSKDENLAWVEKNGKVGFIDKANKLVIPYTFADAQTFSEGLAPATMDGRHWGFIDKSGKFIIAPTYVGALSFSDGLALVYQPPAQNFWPS